MTNRTQPVYGLLLAVWCLIAVWQVIEHGRIKQAARSALINRSRDITRTLEAVIQSQRRFGGLLFQDRLESALKELVKSGELTSVALLNAAGEVVASAGTPMDFETKGAMRPAEHWDYRSVTLVNLVDLGANVAREGETNRPTIILPRREPGAPPRDGERPPRPGDETRTNDPVALLPPPGRRTPCPESPTRLATRWSRPTEAIPAPDRETGRAGGRGSDVRPG